MMTTERVQRFSAILASLGVLGESLRLAVAILREPSGTTATDGVWVMDSDVVYAYAKPSRYARGMKALPTDSEALGRNILELSYGAGIFSGFQSFFMSRPHLLEYSALAVAAANRATVDLGMADIHGTEQLSRIAQHKDFGQVVEIAQQLERNQEVGSAELKAAAEFLYTNALDLMVVAGWHLNTEAGRLERFSEACRIVALPDASADSPRIDAYVAERSNDRSADGRLFWRLLMDDLTSLRLERPAAASYTDAFGLLFCAGVRAATDSARPVYLLTVSRAMRDVWHRRRKEFGVTGRVRIVHPKVFGVAKMLLEGGQEAQIESLCSELEAVGDIERALSQASHDGLEGIAKRDIETIIGMVQVVAEKWRAIQGIGAFLSVSAKEGAMRGERVDARIVQIVRAAQAGSIRSILVERSVHLLDALGNSQRLLGTATGGALAGAIRNVRKLDVESEAGETRASLAWMPCGIALQTAELSAVVSSMHAGKPRSIVEFAKAFSRVFASDEEAERDMCLAYLYGAAGQWDLGASYVSRAVGRAKTAGIRAEAHFFAGVCQRMRAAREEGGGLEKMVRCVRELEAALEYRRDPRYLKELGTSIALAHMNCTEVRSGLPEAHGIPDLAVAEAVWEEALELTADPVLRMQLANNLFNFEIELATGDARKSRARLDLAEGLARQEYGTEEEWPPMLQDTSGWGRWKVERGGKGEEAARARGVRLVGRALNDQHLSIWERRIFVRHLRELESNAPSSAL